MGPEKKILLSHNNQNTKCIKQNIKKLLTQSIQEIYNTMKSPNIRIIGIEENEDSQLKAPENHRRKLPNLKKEMAIKVQEAYRTPNKWDQKRNHLIT